MTSHADQCFHQFSDADIIIYDQDFWHNNLFPKDLFYEMALSYKYSLDNTMTDSSQKGTTTFKMIVPGVHPTSKVSTALTSSLKLLTFNTLLHSGAYLGMSLSPCHMSGGSGFSQIVRAARRLISEKISRRGSL